jgi:hypothetical protein
MFLLVTLRGRGVGFIRAAGGGGVKGFYYGFSVAFLADDFDAALGLFEAAFANFVELGALLIAVDKIFQWDTIRLHLADELFELVKSLGIIEIGGDRDGGGVGLGRGGRHLSEGWRNPGIAAKPHLSAGKGLSSSLLMRPEGVSEGGEKEVLRNSLHFFFFFPPSDSM